MDNSKDFDKFVENIEDGKLELIKLYFCSEFLDKIINLSDNNSRPIHLAARSGNVDVVEYLLTEGSDIEVETTNGKRPLHFAVMEGHGAAVQLLLSRGCDIEAETINGERPIHYAAMKGHLDVIKILVDRNCRLEPRNRDGNTPLALAATFENEECMALLVSAIESRKATPMLNLITEKAVPIKELLNQHFVSTIIDPEKGKTLLDMVLEKNDETLLDMIKAKPVGREELDDFSSEKVTGIRAESYKILQECLLYRCIRHGDYFGVCTLSTVDIVNRSTLFMGPTVFEMLMEYKTIEHADRFLKTVIHVDESWDRAMDILKRDERDKALANVLTRKGYLERREKIGWSRLHIAVFDNCPEMIQHILDNKLFPIEIGDKNNGTPLSLGYALLYTDCIEVLEKNNASANSCDRYNQSPLHVAISSGMFDCCDYLLENMIDLEVKDAYGFTVLDRARKAKYNELCDKLLAKGAIYNDNPRIYDSENYGLPIY